jgi:hypothetical protein
MGEAEPPAALADRELIERHVARVIVKPQALEVVHQSVEKRARRPTGR